jgi:hypothetical protein
VEIADKVVVVVEPSAAERDTEVSVRKRNAPPVDPTLLAGQSPSSGPLVAAGLPVPPWRDPRTMLALGVVMAVGDGARGGALRALGSRGETEMAGPRASCAGRGDGDADRRGKTASVTPA